MDDRRLCAIGRRSSPFLCLTKILTSVDGLDLLEVLVGEEAEEDGPDEKAEIESSTNSDACGDHPDPVDLQSRVFDRSIDSSAIERKDRKEIDGIPPEVGPKHRHEK